MLNECRDVDSYNKPEVNHATLGVSATLQIHAGGFVRVFVGVGVVAGAVEEDMDDSLLQKVSQTLASVHFTSLCLEHSFALTSQSYRSLGSCTKQSERLSARTRSNCPPFVMFRASCRLPSFLTPQSLLGLCW